MNFTTPEWTSSVLGYDPFGMITFGRSWSVGGEYRYGFNAQEQDDEVYGNGNLNTAEFWEYDTRLGRRWNVDPKPNTFTSVYAVFLNSPITTIDIAGDTTNYYSKSGDFLGSLMSSKSMSDVIISEKKFNKLMNANYEGWNNNPNQKTPNTQDPIYDNFLNDGQMEALLNKQKGIYKIDLNDKVGMLARLGYAEFRNGNETEMTAAYDIALNRVNGPGYPNNLEDVIKQDNQFSFWYDHNLEFYERPYSKIDDSKINYIAWSKAVSASIKINNGIGRGISKGATLYYSPRSMNPSGSQPSWDFTKLIEVSVDGVREDYMKLYIQK